MDTDHSGGVRVGKEKKQAIALRISDQKLYGRLEELANEQHISMNLAVNMLLGFAFNEVDRQKKKFVPKIVFESE
ncbi:MAG TPA: hypothetical protein VMB52_01630 [Verrucomicrobiae bacterium]|nr:hypothetical protein [Verrucomicrobiae bacterium]